MLNVINFYSTTAINLRCKTKTISMKKSKLEAFAKNEIKAAQTIIGGNDDKIRVAVLDTGIDYNFLSDESILIK